MLVTEMGKRLAICIPSVSLLMTAFPSLYDSTRHMSNKMWNDDKSID